MKSRGIRQPRPAIVATSGMPNTGVLPVTGGIPDQHVLTEPDLHPEATESPQKFAEIMQVLVMKHVGERTVSSQQDAGHSIPKAGHSADKT